jgi:hypothetical protein
MPSNKGMKQGAMSLDALVIDLLRPSGALHTIVVKTKTDGDHVVVADIADARPPDSAGQLRDSGILVRR